MGLIANLAKAGLFGDGAKDAIMVAEQIRKRVEESESSSMTPVQMAEKEFIRAWDEMLWTWQAQSEFPELHN